MTFIIFILWILFGFYLHSSISLKCYECTGHVPCGNGQTHLQVNCGGKCMVYRNQYDGGKKFAFISLFIFRKLKNFRLKGTIVRRCCWSNCGPVGTSMYEGRYTYFCTDDLRNGDIADINLI